MKIKKTFLITLFMTLPFIFIVGRNVKAETKNPIFATIKYVDGLFAELMTRIDVDGNRISTLEQQVISLDQRVADLESTTELINGVMVDMNSPQLGPITYSGTSEGYHFWFTPNTGALGYVAGHFYHVMYWVSPEYPSEWCWQIPVVDRPPYNLFGIPAESLVYFKITDITTGLSPCF